MRDAFWLGEEERQTRELARALARERIAPLAAQVDETEAYPAEQLRLLGAQGLMGLYVPEAYGGGGAAAHALGLSAEGRPRGRALPPLIYSVSGGAGQPLRSRAADPRNRRHPPPSRRG